MRPGIKPCKCCPISIAGVVDALDGPNPVNLLASVGSSSSVL